VRFGKRCRIVSGFGREGEKQGFVGDEVVKDCGKEFRFRRRSPSAPRPEREKKHSSRAGSPAKKPKTSIAMDSAAALESFDDLAVMAWS
jgi:hypothetical protein